MRFTRDQIQKTFSPNEIVKNGDVISFDYKELQIDLIYSPNEEFDYSLFYFGFNDCQGNLIGKLFHKLGLKHGHNGLGLPVRDGDNKFGEVLLTLDFKKALSLVGLDSKDFDSGFDNIEQIFDIISKSPFYSPHSYKLENLNTIARVRDRKRETYRKFLAFGEAYTGPTYQSVSDKGVYLKKIFETFPDAHKEYRELVSKLALKKLAAQKFDGYIVSNITNLKDKQLGMFMQYLRNDYQLKPENVVLISEARVKELILQNYETYKETKE